MRKRDKKALRSHASLVLRRRLSRTAVYGLVLAYATTIIVPVYYVVVSSFKNNQAIFESPLTLPTSFGLANFFQAQEVASLTAALRNSAVITIVAELVTLALAIPASYALARIPSRVGGVLERSFGLGFLIPVFAVLLPTFLLSVITGLFRTRTFLIFFYPATALPLSIILLTQFMRSIPAELEESARMDGAGHLTILRKIFVPLVVPGISTVAILNFLAFWNEYVFALVILGPESRTVQVALPTLRTGQVVDYGLLAAGIVMTLLPVYVVYAFMQRRMREALVAGAVKG